MQLCTLPWPGFVPDGVPSAPPVAVGRPARQLGLPVEALRGYGVSREQTRTDHLRKVARYLGAVGEVAGTEGPGRTPPPSCAASLRRHPGRHKQQVSGAQYPFHTATPIWKPLTGTYPLRCPWSVVGTSRCLSEQDRREQRTPPDQRACGPGRRSTYWVFPRFSTSPRLRSSGDRAPLS
ncbi:DUF4158 domain-containing protein [Streptomyces sp. NPDC056231]|uniref:DUF4158 domain-containing protein n=1 Tax=Streptomyces sp. NPDC056231 TaxID=3345755 RepID=UPI003AAB6EDD